MSLELQVGELKGVVTAVKDDVAQIKADVRFLLVSENRRKGGWAVLSVICGFLGGLLMRVL